MNNLVDDPFLHKHLEKKKEMREMKENFELIYIQEKVMFDRLN